MKIERQIYEFIDLKLNSKKSRARLRISNLKISEKMNSCLTFNSIKENSLIYSLNN